MTEASLFYDKREFREFPALCDNFTGKALQSPYRSTVPLLSLVHHHPAEWHSLLSRLGVSEVTRTHFEYAVASAKLGGNPSQTDAMLFSQSLVCGIEAKWTEPRYESVRARLARPESDGGDPSITVEGWVRHLRPYGHGDLKVDEVEDVVYQVLHRAASIGATATAHRLRPALVYLHFHPSPLKSSATTEGYVEDLRRLRCAMGEATSFAMQVVEMPIEALPAFEAIQNLDKRAPSSAAKVRSAICAAPLFVFGEPRLFTV
jgi:hypothetical protein